MHLVTTKEQFFKSGNGKSSIVPQLGAMITDNRPCDPIWQMMPCSSAKGFPQKATHLFASSTFSASKQISFCSKNTDQNDQKY